MFESLTDKLQGAFGRLGRRGTLTEEDLDEALREIRMALLEADVNYKVAKDFIKGTCSRGDNWATVGLSLQRRPAKSLHE